MINIYDVDVAVAVSVRGNLSFACFHHPPYIQSDSDSHIPFFLSSLISHLSSPSGSHQARVKRERPSVCDCDCDCDCDCEGIKCARDT
jgi:hypothetical protein